MFRNYLAAALRNMARNKLYTAINVIGLAVGFAAAILIALYVRDEFSYDRWIPLHERTYLLNAIVSTPGGNLTFVHTPAYFAARMEHYFPQIEAVARLSGTERVSIRHGQIEDNEEIYWGDPNIFDLLRLPVIAGDLRNALQKPDGLVLTRKIARKYFGRDTPIGETLELYRQHPMTVTAVLEDLPSNTHLNLSIIASGRAAFSSLTHLDSLPPADFLVDSLTYVRLRAGASVDVLNNAMPSFIQRNGFLEVGPKPFPEMFLQPLAAIHMAQSGTKIVETVTAVGFLTVLIASINFVNLMTARASLRAAEVGMRKVAGATRRDLIFQFIGESLMYVTLGTVMALALAELLLPSLNAFLDRTIVFDWWRNSAYAAFLFGFVLLVGILAGAYPALVLSAFRPISTGKGGLVQGGGSGAIRRFLVVFQFAALIGLVLITGIIYRQMQFALNEGIRLDRDQVIVVTGGCRDAFQSAVAALPGVRNVACSSSQDILYTGQLDVPVKRPGGIEVYIGDYSVGVGFFEFYGLHPLAGRSFSKDRVGDAIPDDPNVTMNAPIILNEAAVHKLGFATAEAAIGKTISIRAIRKGAGQSQIIGVVPDFSLNSVHTKVPPTLFPLDRPKADALNIKLSGRDIPETLKSIDRAWDQTGATQPIRRIFLDQRVQELYRDIVQQDAVFTVLTGIALFIACIGLFALSVHSATRRTKEVGIRKAMGAGSDQIIRLLTLEFIKPVLWASLLAWPVSYYFMNRWLSGFAYHVEIEPWMFVASGGLALLIALATVLGYSILTARAKPVTALRYE